MPNTRGVTQQENGMLTEKVWGRGTTEDLGKELFRVTLTSFFSLDLLAVVAGEQVSTFVLYWRKKNPVRQPLESKRLGCCLNTNTH